LGATDRLVSPGGVDLSLRLTRDVIEEAVGDPALVLLGEREHLLEELLGGVGHDSDHTSALASAPAHRHSTRPPSPAPERPDRAASLHRPPAPPGRRVAPLGTSQKRASAKCPAVTALASASTPRRSTHRRRRKRRAARVPELR